MNETREWVTDDEHGFAHQLREGMDFAKKNPDKVGERYSLLKDRITITTTRDKVIAKRRFTLTVKAVGTHSLSYPEVTSIGEIVTTVLRDKQLNEWRFPSISLDSIDVKKLLKWAVSENKSASQVGDSLIIRNAEKETTTDT